MAQTVAVIGAGLMGGGIAELFARAGHAVRLYDSDTTAAAATADGIATRTTAPVTSHPDLRSAVTSADLVIEAVTENIDLKLRLLGQASESNARATIASNTSTFVPSSIDPAIVNPSRFLIAHFFNHPLVVPLVELVPGPATDAAVTAALETWLVALGKTPVVLGRERPGFVANRLQAALLREAFALEAEGVISFAGLDLVVRAGLAPRWAAAGPIELTDLGGLDVWNAVCTQLFPSLANDTSPPTALVQRVAQGDLGSKTGQGFFAHEISADAEVRARMGRHFALEFPATP